jgi:hypothetical protein
MPDLHRLIFYPCQLADGSTHVIGPGDRVVATFEDPDTAVRWRKAVGRAGELNREHYRQVTAIRVRQRWAILILVAIGLVIWLAS